MSKRKFSPKDWAKIKYGEYAGKCCRVRLLEKNGRYMAVVYNEAWEPGEMMSFDARVLDKLPALTISHEELKDLAGAKTLYREYKDRVFPPFNIEAEDSYELTAEDIRDALVRINAREDCLEAFKEWFWIILNVFYEDLEIDKRLIPDFFSDSPENDDEMFNVAFSMAEKLYWKLEERFGTKEDTEKHMVSFADDINWEADNAVKVEESGYKSIAEDIISRVNVYIFNKDRPEDERIFSSSEKHHIISGYSDQKSLDEATDEAIEVFRNFVEDLYNEGDLLATKILAWGYFEGTKPYTQNWALAYKYMKEYFEMSGDPQAATALGMINLKGGAHQGVPQLQDAFRDLIYGSMGGVDEATFRAADMLMEGRGTVKNIDIGLNMLVEGYRNSMASFCAGRYDSMLAEYALRMGNACRDGLFYGMNLRDAFKFYLEADFAVKYRMKKVKGSNSFGTALKVGFEINRLKEKIGLDGGRTQLKTDFPLYIHHLFEDRLPLKVTLNVSKDKTTGTLTIARNRPKELIERAGLLKEGSSLRQFYTPPEILVAFPELMYANMVSELTYTLENIVVANKSSRHSSFMVDGFRKNDHTHGLEFFFNGSLVAAIDTEWYVIDLKNLKAQEKKDEDENKYV